VRGRPATQDVQRALWLSVVRLGHSRAGSHPRREQEGSKFKDAGCPVEVKHFQAHRWHSYPHVCHERPLSGTLGRLGAGGGDHLLKQAKPSGRERITKGAEGRRERISSHMMTKNS